MQEKNRVRHQDQGIQCPKYRQPILLPIIREYTFEQVSLSIIHLHLKLQLKQFDNRGLHFAIPQSDSFTSGCLSKLNDLDFWTHSPLTQLRWICWGLLNKRRYYYLSVGCQFTSQLKQKLSCILPSGAWWLIGRFDTFRPKGRRFKYRSSRHVGTFGKSFTRSCLWHFGTKRQHSIRALSGAPLRSRVDLKRPYRMNDLLQKKSVTSVWRTEWPTSEGMNDLEEMNDYP